MTVCMLHGRCRAAARRLGPDRHVVTVLERHGAPGAVCCARACARMQPGVSAHLATLHAANGVALRLNAGLRAVGGSADGRPVAELADGSSIAADAIVLGVGLTPNDALARDAGIACDRGVLVDERCRTSAPDVYAAGDVAVSARPGGGACGWSPGRTRRIRARRRRCRRWAWAKRIGRPARSGRSNTTPWCRSSAFRRWRPARCCGRRRMPARCCRWRWMRKAAPWRA